jgi:hypothetical protein
MTVKIFAGGAFFQAMAMVLYSRGTVGMGLGFREVKPEFQSVLRKWVRQESDKSCAPLQLSITKKEICCMFIFRVAPS